MRLTKNFMEKPTKKIVIFDDDQDILFISTYVLKEYGWDVTTFTNCNDIIAKVSGIMPDVIMMDNWIPDTGGIAATQLIKRTKELAHIPVVLFSANSEIKSIAEKAGANAYLEKPFELHELEATLNNAIAEC